MAHIGGGEDMVAAVGFAVGGGAGDTRRVVPGEGHGAYPNAVEPAGGILIADGAAVQGIHILLHPGIGEAENLACPEIVGEVDINIAVVILNVGNVAAESGKLPNGAVGNADLHAALLTVGGGQVLQGLPLEADQNREAAVIGVGGDIHLVAMDIVIVAGPSRLHGGREQGRHQEQAHKEG